MSDNEDNENESDKQEADAGQVAPLGWDQHGGPISYPAEAVGFRVRRFNLGARGGAPDVVYGDGVPLVIELGASVDELRHGVDGVAGKYRLDAVDHSGRLLADVPPAYIFLGGSAQPATHTADPLARVLDSVERLARTNADAMEKLTAQMGTVMEASSRIVAAADSAGVTRREPPAAPPVQVLAPYAAPQGELAPQVPADPSAAAAFWRAFADGLTPQIPMILGGLAQLFNKTPDAPAATPPAGDKGGA